MVIRKWKRKLCKYRCLYNALLASCEYGNLKLVMWILDIFKLLNYSLDMDEYLKIFTKAYYMNKYHIIKYLYHHDKNIFRQFGVKNFNYMFLASGKNNNTKMAKFIHRKGSKLNFVNIHENFEEPFISACKNGNIELANWILETGDRYISPVVIISNSDEAFMKAYKFDHINIVVWLCSLCTEYSYITVDGNILCYINCKRV
jgi:hypothetical protein